MHPVLSKFPSNFFYEGALQNGVSAEVPSKSECDVSVCSGPDPAGGLPVAPA